jgi:hypothetical protein
VRDQVSHPYNTTGKITVLYILIFRFFHMRREDKTPAQGSIHACIRIFHCAKIY